MRMLRNIAAALLGVTFAFGGMSLSLGGVSPASAEGKMDLTPGDSQVNTPSDLKQLNDAIAAGDTAAINALVVANQGNPTVLAQIANVLLASAQATSQAGNPAGAAVLAALAVQSGGLTKDNKTLAMNIVSQSPTVLALLSKSPSAPNTGGGTFASITVGNLVIASTVTNYSPSQSTGSPS